MMSEIKNNYGLLVYGLLAVLIAGVGTYHISQNIVTAQEGPMVQNNMSAGFKKAGMNFSSSINVHDVLAESLASKVNLTLSDAISVAENNVGAGSFAKEASLEAKHGYLVYKVKVSDSENEKHKVIIDPGTGEVIMTKKIDYGYGEKMYGSKYSDGKKSKSYGHGR
jgi:hypothetical protein